MKFDHKHHHRISKRLKEFDYSTPCRYYITICSYHKQMKFGKVRYGEMILNKYGIIVEEEWLKAKDIRSNVDLDYYVVMPNYFHGIIIIESRDTARCVPTNDKRKFGEMIPGSLPVIVHSFKSAVTKRINEVRNKTALPVW